MTHICVSKLTIIVSYNGLSPGRREAIIWTNDGILLIRTFRTHFSEIVSEIHTFTFKNMHFKMSSGKWWPSCLGLNVLISSRCFTYALLYHWCYVFFQYHLMNRGDIIFLTISAFHVIDVLGIDLLSWLLQLVPRIWSWRAYDLFIGQRAGGSSLKETGKSMSKDPWKHIIVE